MMMKSMQQNKTPFIYDNEAGNAFLIVMLGIVLFATLAFTISRSMRSDNTTRLSNREIHLAVADILDYGQRVSRAVDRLRRKGCSESEISFNREGIDGWNAGDMYDNTDAPSDLSCHLFYPQGGNISGPERFPEQYITTACVEDLSQCLAAFGGANWYQHRPAFGGKQAIGDIGTTAPDLYFLLPDLKLEICLKINDNLGITNPSGAPPSNFGTTYQNSRGYDGSFSTGAGMGVTGENQGCVSDAGKYFYYQALIVR